MRGFALIAACGLAVSLSSAALAQEAEVLGEKPAEAEVQPKPAEVRAEQLDVLFARLYKSNGAATQGLEQKIWALWSASDSATAEVLLQQAERAMKDGAPAQSLSILDRLIGTYPDFAEAWNKRATLYYRMKRDDASLKDIDKVLDLEPRHFGALAGKGMILKRQKKYSAAMDAFKEALAINPGMEVVQEAVKDLERLEQGI
jgi:tetratricopeptide (TPR) repeat protein